MMNLVSNLIKISESMLAHAQCGEWASVAQVDLERRRDLEILFSTQQGPALSALATELQYIVELDKKIIEAIRRARNERIASLKAVEHGKRMQRAYKQVG